MRFLFVGSFSNVGGSALATLPFIQTLRQAGHTVQLAHWVRPNRTDLFRDQDLLNLDLAQYKNIVSKIYCLTCLAFKYDAIIAISELTPTYACQIAGWIAKRPVFGELQVHLDSWIKDNSNPVHHLLSRCFYPRLSGLRCVSQALANYAVQSLSVASDKTFVVYNGFDIEQVQKLSNEVLPIALNAWFRSPVVLCAGRLTQQKRFDLAIQAFVITQSKLLIKSHLVILGEGELRQELQDLTDRLGLQDLVHLVGLYKNPFPLFKQASMFLLSSDYEGFGRVLVEAMICGCPVIAHDCPVGPREILEDGQSGYLVPSNSPEILSDAIINLFHSTKLKKQFIQQGYDRAQAFKQESICQQYMSNFQKLYTKKKFIAT